MRISTCLVCLFAMASICGCGGVASQPVTALKPPELKAILIKLSENGNLEDVKDGISTQIEKIEETDATKAKVLATDFDALRKATNPTQMKDLAKKMADKL